MEFVRRQEHDEDLFPLVSQNWSLISAVGGAGGLVSSSLRYPLAQFLRISSPKGLKQP